MKTGPWWVRGVLWAGVVLCLYALWRSIGSSELELGHVAVASWVCIAVLLAAMWGTSILAWICFVRAHTGQTIRTSDAVRQSGLLLVGKYIPGGVFGFVARLRDGRSEQRSALLVSGLVEQFVGISVPLLLGSIAYMAAHHGWLILTLTLVVPLITWLISLFWNRICLFDELRRRYSGLLAIKPDPVTLLAASFLVSLQVATYMSIVALVAYQIFSLDLLASIGTAGAFALAVSAGMMAILVPGGIGIRESALIALALPFLMVEHAVFLAALMRVILTIFDLVAGVVAVLISKCCGSEKLDCRT